MFKLDPAGRETVLHHFMGGADGAWPYAGLVIDGAGNLYGATVAGGSGVGACKGHGCGVIFKLDTTGKETVLYRFTGGAEGHSPTEA